MSSPRAEATSVTTFIFLAMESQRVNRHSGMAMAMGMPGNPPPVPASNMLSGLSPLFLIKRTRARECRTWWM